MNISDLAEDYLIDVPIEIGTLFPQVKNRKEGMRKLTASFLNEVMQREAKNQTATAHPAASSRVCKVPSHEIGNTLADPLQSQMRMPFIPDASNLDVDTGKF